MLPSVKLSVYEAIAAVDPAAATVFNRRFFHPDRVNPTLALELHDVNNFWRLELSKLQGDTLRARSALRDDIPIERWLVSFIHDVIPCVVDLWYPSVQGGKYE